MAAKSGHARKQPVYQLSKLRTKASVLNAFGTSPTCAPLDLTPTDSQKMSEDLTQIGGWLEAMKSSSPRFNHHQIEEKNDWASLEATAKAQYQEWVIKHPSALHMFEAISRHAKGKQVAVFLDYDGTLSPIVDDPDCAFISEEMQNAVKHVSALFPTAIITGRCRDKVYEFVRLPELYYAGSHGMDIMGPAEGCNGLRVEGLHMKNSEGIDVVLFQPASKYLPLMNEVYNLLKERTKKYSGARVEHNKYCVTLHFRCVKEEAWAALAEELQEILKEHPQLTLTQGRKVLELRPAIEWDKGKALEFLLKSFGLGQLSEVFPVYIGDDRTDEDAFQVLKEREFSCSILVSKVPKPTCAMYSLEDPSQVMQFLQKLVDWKARLASNGRHAM